MKCPKCGVKNAADAAFCRACGENLSALIIPSDEITLVTDRNILDRFLVKERFKILKKLGEGGMGEVLLAEDIKLKRKVAIKSVLKSNMADTNSKIRFLREAQTASQLDHPNICTIYEIYEESDKDYIVMQYVDGVTLDNIIGLKQLGVDKILDISIQVCSGMVEAHGKEIIHRDIKPANIMVDKKGVVKILDFGLAKFSDKSAVKNNGFVDSNLTEKGFVMGTVAYISPEQAKGKPLDRGTDVFSFGVVLYEMIEGENPFKKEEQIETLYNILNKEVEFTRKIPEELKVIVRKALEKESKNRYPDFSRLKEDLEAFQSFYTQLKEKKADGGATEIINAQEQEVLLKELQKSSDKEDLGDMVYRIKKSKASTERVVTTKKRRLKYLWIPAILVLALIAVVSLVDKKKDETVYIYLHPFENATGEKSLPEMIDYLLMESLNQFDRFKTINEEAALPMAGNENKEVDLQLLKKKFNVKYQLLGEMSKQENFYTIDARLKPIDKSGKPFLKTTTGEGKDSLLASRGQLDSLTRFVYRKFFPGKTKNPEFKNISEIFGTDWFKFSNFYAGLLYFKKIENNKAEYYFSKCLELPISKYHLARLSYFEGERKKARELIAEIPVSDKLTDALRLKVRAMEARLNFRFKAQIENLEKLKEKLPFSKEVFLELGEAHFHHANPEGAIPYYNKAIELDSRYSNAINHLGYCYSYIGDHGKAIELFEQYRDLGQSANSFDSLGDGYFYAGRLEEAEIMKKRAVVPDEDKNRLSYPYQTLADIYILRAQYRDAREALKNYRRLKDTKKRRGYVLAKEAFIQFNEGKYDAALELINQSLETFDVKGINDNTAEVHWLKGLILLALNKVEKSKEELQWLAEFKNKYRLDRENFHAAFKYFIHLDALVLEKENRLEKAEERFKFLIDMKTRLSYWITYYNYPFFHSEYVKYLSRHQRYEEALEEVDKCLEFNSGYIPALRLKADLMEKKAGGGTPPLPGL